jgi:hypothetical protein
VKVEEIGGETEGDFMDKSIIDEVLGTCTYKPS